MITPPSSSSPSCAQIYTTMAPTNANFTKESSHLHFSLKIMQKLKENNFRMWLQQVEPYIKAHNLTNLVVCTKIPPHFLMMKLAILVLLILSSHGGFKIIKCYIPASIHTP